MTTKHLNQLDLSRRWAISPRTLERWRWQAFGPDFVKVGGRVLYRLCDVERYETENLHQANPVKPAELTPVKLTR